MYYNIRRQTAGGKKLAGPVAKTSGNMLAAKAFVP